MASGETNGKGRLITSLADTLFARHAIFPLGKERLRDEPKERLRGRVGVLQQ